MADKNQALAKALRTSSNEPQYIRGNLLPFKKDIKTKEVSFGMPTVAQSLIDALTAPYRAMKGEIDVDSPQGVQEALNFGLNFMGGGSIPAIGKAVPHGQLGITAYHGSPFKFDKFDLNKAKEGTGVNLFGKGVYLTDNPNVAKHYAGDKGYVYKVDVPDKNVESMIPYMEKIKNQNTKVQELANRYNPELQKIMELQNLKNPNAQVSNIDDLYTSDLFRAMGRLNKEAEPKLIQEGIPGVYHPNIGGKATNYVVYDPSILKILERN
jgi:hypothetical protein